MGQSEVIDVAVILINYNSSEYTINCVDSIRKKTAADINYKIIVIDNASDIGDYEKLKAIAKYSCVEIIRSKVNLGYAAGNMFGVQFISASHYFFLNNDCVLLNDCISILKNFLKENASVGMCSPQMYSSDNQLVRSFDYFPNLFIKLFGVKSLKLFMGKNYLERKKEYFEPIKVDVISGSQIFIRGNVFRNIGGFDTTFFLYCEEEDISFKVKKAGYYTYLIPEAKNMHFGGASTKRNYLIRKEYYISFLYMYRKHYGYIAAELMKLLLFVKVIRKSFSNSENLKLAIFILGGANIKNSLKHVQKIQEM